MARSIAFFILILFGTGYLPAQGTTAFPSIEDFEKEIQCPQNSCGPVCPLIGKWQNDTADNLDWGSDVGGTPSPGTGPSTDHTLGNAAGHYLYIEASCSATGFPNKTANLLSPVYDFTNLSNPELEFWYHMRGSTMGTMHVDISTNGGTSWTNNVVPSWTGNQNSWLFKDINLAAYAGQGNIRLRIRGITGSDLDSDMAVDDILVYEQTGRDIQMLSLLSPVSGCALGTAEPVKVALKNFGQNTLNGDTVHITARRFGAPAISEQFVLPGNLATGDTIHYTFSGTVDLSAPGLHQVSAWATMSGDLMRGDDSTVKVLRNFERINGLPYAQDFENGHGGWHGGGPKSTWAFGVPNKPIINSAASGTRCWVTGGLFNGKYEDLEASWLESPCIDLSGACNPWIELKLWVEAETSYDGASVQYSTDGGAGWTTVGSATTGINWYNDNFINGAPGGDQKGWTGDLGAGTGGWIRARHELSALAGLSDVLLRVAFGSDENTERDGVGVDDIVIYDGAWVRADTNTCAPDSILLESGAQGSGYSYLWSTGATTPSIWATTGGQYWVEVTSGNCTARDTVNLQFEQAIQPAFTVEDSACPVIYFRDNSGGGIPATWSWTFGNGNSSSLQNASTSYANSGNGFYTVSMTVSNACGSFTANQQILIGCVIAVDEALDGAMKVYPNPASESIKVESAHPIRFFAADGQELQLPGSGNEQLRVIDVSGLPAGIYFIRSGNESRALSILR